MPPHECRPVVKQGALVGIHAGKLSVVSRMRVQHGARCLPMYGAHWSTSHTHSSRPQLQADMLPNKAIRAQTYALAHALLTTRVRVQQGEAA